MSRIAGIVLAGVLCCFASLPLFGQSLGAVEDTTPLERPRPVLQVKTQTPSDILQRIVDVVITNGYAIQESDGSSIDATKRDSNESENYDRVIIWLERDFDRPSEIVKVFLIYGRFELLWGNQIETVRIHLTEVEARNRVSDLRAAIYMELIFGGDDE